VPAELPQRRAAVVGCDGVARIDRQRLLGGLQRRAGLAVSSNAPVTGVATPKEAPGAHRLLDLGDDEYTVGRPHPMIDPSLRDDMVRAAFADPEVAVVLVDVVIGYGAHDDPATDLVAVLPAAEEFGYSMRVVSEITESNGSSSMASVCGGSLSLMDAGVPLKAHVAGIAMGLIKEGNRFAVLTDILGDEDHLGDMDFKVAGTTEGVSALQMDIKITGITKEIMQVALTQAREARLHILGIMNAAEAQPHEMSQYAPRILSMKINPEKIRDVIGKGGATIRALTEETGTQIDIAEDGTIKIACTSTESGALAKKRIEDITAEVEVGKAYDGTVLKILDFGAIVNILPGKDGLLHISQIAHQRVNAVTDHLKEGQAVQVKVLETDEKGRMRLSMKALIEPPAAPAAAPAAEAPAAE